VQLLVQSKDVRIESKDKYGRTPFSYAASGRHETVMNLLEVRRE
jgi:ankyrin repeat protein